MTQIDLPSRPAVWPAYTCSVLVLFAYLWLSLARASAFNSQVDTATASPVTSANQADATDVLAEANFRYYQSQHQPKSRLAPSVFAKYAALNTATSNSAFANLDDYIYRHLQVKVGQYSRPLMNIYREYGTHLDLTKLNKILQARTAEGEIVGAVDPITGIRAPKDGHLQVITYHYLDSDKIEKKYGINKAANDYPNVVPNGIRILRVIDAIGNEQAVIAASGDATVPRANTAASESPASAAPTPAGQPANCQVPSGQNPILQRVTHLKQMFPSNPRAHLSQLDDHTSGDHPAIRAEQQKSFFRQVTNQLVSTLSSSYIVIRELSDHLEVKSFADCGVTFYINHHGFKVELPNPDHPAQQQVILHNFRD